jgi:hypothetical protein
MTKRSACVLLVVMLSLAGMRQPAAAAPAAAPNGPAATNSTGNCVADWLVSYSGNSSYTLLRTDPADTPLSELRFSRSYNDPTDLSHGYLDFNSDHHSDVFSVSPLGGGDYLWRYSPSGSGDWVSMAFDSTPLDDLRFGDFNGDGFTDVFSVDPNSGRWRYSSGGTASYTNLADDNLPVDQLRFGDFNGDGRTDVFARKQNGANVAWDVSYSGTANYVTINNLVTPLAEMQFGDIDGDGHTDVVTTQPDGDSFDWLWASHGAGNYQILSTRPEDVHHFELAGNFNPADNINLYHGTDFFYTLTRGDGSQQWWYFYARPPSTEGDNPLAYDSVSPDQLRFADFNGDGVTDVFKLQQRCTVDLPVALR